jgi:steroid delta-isomerase-like uncharacterized protein
MSEQNKAVVRRWIDIWNGADPSELHDIASPDIHFRSSQIPASHGVDAVAQVVHDLRAAFPDGHFSTDELVAEGDTVVNRWTFSGTQQGEWMGQPASGKQVAVNGTATNHLRDGKIVEQLTDWDAMGMMQQLGAIES